jgi:hypothetical protein
MGLDVAVVVVVVVVVVVFPVLMVLISVSAPTAYDVLFRASVFWWK